MALLKDNTKLRDALLNGIPRDFLPPLRSRKILTQEDEAMISSKQMNGERAQMIELLDILSRRLQSVGIGPLLQVLKDDESLCKTYQDAIRIMEEHESIYDGCNTDDTTSHEEWHYGHGFSTMTAFQSLLYQPHVRMWVLAFLSTIWAAVSYYSTYPFQVGVSFLFVQFICIHIGLVMLVTDDLAKVTEHLKQSYRERFSKVNCLFKEWFDISQVWIDIELKDRRGRRENYLDAIMKALRGSGFVLLKGIVGTGKTMTGKRLARGWAEGEIPQYDLVFCARFRDIKKRSKTVWKLTLDGMVARNYLRPSHAKWLLSQMQNIDHRPKSTSLLSRIIRLFKPKKIHVLCVADGFDERSAENIELDGMFHSDDLYNLPASLVVTSRPSAYENESESVSCPAPTLIFSPLDYAKINEFIAAYLVALGVQDVEEEVDKLTDKFNHSDIWHLASVPLLLSCLCFMRHEIYSSSPVRIYLDVCQALVVRQPEFKDKIKFTHKKLSDVCGDSPETASISGLADLSLAALIGDRGFKPGTFKFGAADLKRLLKEGDVSMWLKIGLLNRDREDTIGEGIYYEFLYKEFQQILAAAALFRKLVLTPYELPIFFAYRTIKKRLDTFFFLWPQVFQFQRPIDMAVAGFFYDLINGTVKCFHCGGKITNGENRAEIPLWQHAANSPFCYYLHQIAGREFIDFIKRNRGMECLHQFTSARGYPLHITDYRQIDRKYLPEQRASYFENLVVAVVWRKDFEAVRATDMWNFVLEMATVSEDESNIVLIKNNAVSSVYNWYQNGQKISISTKFLEHLLRLFPSLSKGRQNELEIVEMFHKVHTSPSSMLQIASRTKSPMYKVNDNAVYISDLDTVLLVPKHKCNADINAIQLGKKLSWCMVEQNVFDSLSTLPLFWEKISRLTINVTNNEPVDEELMSQVEPCKLQVKSIILSFDRDIPAGFSRSQLFTKSILMNAKSMAFREFVNISLKSNEEGIDIRCIEPRLDVKCIFMFLEYRDSSKLPVRKAVFSSYPTENGHLVNGILQIPNCPRTILIYYGSNEPFTTKQFIHLLRTQFPTVEQTEKRHVVELCFNDLNSSSIERLYKRMCRVKMLKDTFLFGENDNCDNKAVLYQLLDAKYSSKFTLVDVQP